MVTGNADDEAENPVYISYSDICYYAGGLWVWNAGEGPNAYCGCRYMNRKNGLVGEQIFSVKGPNGQDLTVQIDFRSSMEYQTPGGKKDNEEYQAIHDVLTVVELGLIAVSFVAGPAAPLFIGVSALVGVADSAIYFQQGDKYMGIMMMAISMLGIDDVVSLVKYAAAKTTIKTLGKEGIQAIAKKQLAKEVLSESEELAVREIQTAVYQSQNGLNSSMKLAMMDEFVTTGVYSTAIKNNWGWDKFFEMYYKINKKLLNLPSFTMMTIKIGGIAYTVDQVYLAFYGNDEDRKYSSFGQLFDYFKNASEAEKMQEAQKQFEKMQKEIAKNPKKFLNPETIDQAIGFDWSKTVPMDQLKAYYMALNQWKDPKNAKEQQKIQKEHEFTEAPFLAEVESGESVLSWGVSGDSVTEIQKLLSEKGYDLNVNGIFDMDMIFVVAEFQSKNSLNENGIVDSQTLSKLKSSEKEMNCTEKINSMISSGWVEINKTEYVKKIQSKVSTEKLKEIECNGVKKYFFDSSQKDQPRQVGQAPILKTIVDNPDLQEVYLNFKRFI
jgi:hypothetical protein